MDLQTDNIFTEGAIENKELAEYLNNKAQAALEKFKSKKGGTSEEGCYLGRIPLAHPAGA